LSSAHRSAEKGPDFQRRRCRLKDGESHHAA
jgi:hypothetical protein